MALPLIDGGSRKKRDQMLAVDLGNRTTKAVHIQRRGNKFTLSRYAILDAPIFDRVLSAEMLAEHLKAVSHALDSKTRLVALTLNVNEVIVRHVDMPRMPVEDMRLILKHNSRNYLQQELSNYIFDCHFLPPGPGQSDGDKTGAAQKQKVLVAGAKQQIVDEFSVGAKNAGLVADHIVPGIIGPVNAFEMAMPDVFTNDVVALVDIGFKSTSICILQHGEMILSRVVTYGGDRLTHAISEAMGISYAEAEGIKVGMASEVQSALESVLTPLGRELRASIDFFEHQQDRPVAQVYVAGGSARSEFIVQTLAAELMVECKTWNPASFLQIELPPQQAAEIEQVAPQLAVAIGTAISAL
ncbi:MAG: pilus assembly protein PilM [Verrucomicrobia bacterium]|nr:pilus assembly protein PilM [Verrucomicrobiota bacterium]